MGFRVQAPWGPQCLSCHPGPFCQMWATNVRGAQCVSATLAAPHCTAAHVRVALCWCASVSLCPLQNGFAVGGLQKQNAVWHRTCVFCTELCCAVLLGHRGPQWCINQGCNCMLLSLPCSKFNATTTCAMAPQWGHRHHFVLWPCGGQLGGAWGGACCGTHGGLVLWRPWGTCCGGHGGHMQCVAGQRRSAPLVHGSLAAWGAPRSDGAAMGVPAPVGNPPLLAGGGAAAER